IARLRIGIDAFATFADEPFPFDRRFGRIRDCRHYHPYSGNTRTNLRDPTDRTAGAVAFHAARGSSTTIPSMRTPFPEISRSAARRLSANPARTSTSGTRVQP